jgi:hypothetical protein
MAETPRQDGMRIAGDSSRTPEFREARDGLVGTVNSWLNEQATVNGTLSDENLVKEVSLGPVNDRVNMLGVSYNTGASLRGNGVESPFEYQHVSQDSSGVLEVISISGTDPVARMLRGNEYKEDSRSEKVATFGVKSVSPDGSVNYFRYDFNGDGSVSQHYVSPEGVHTGQALFTAQDIEMATSAFTGVVNSIAS